MNRKASFNALAALLTTLTDDEQNALVDNPDKLKALATQLAQEAVQNTFFLPISDKDLPQQLQSVVTKWRKLASDFGYVGPVAWRVKAGFTLKGHAPQAGPCYEGYKYLQDWNLENDTPTMDGIVFWIPRLVEGSTSKNVKEQQKLLGEVRTRYDLPEHHLTSYGSAALLSGLIHAHFKRTGERTPLNGLYSRTDTLRVDGYRLLVGDFDETGLNCVHWYVDGRLGGLGVFPVAVEMGV